MMRQIGTVIAVLAASFCGGMGVVTAIRLDEAFLEDLALIAILLVFALLVIALVALLLIWGLGRRSQLNSEGSALSRIQPANYPPVIVISPNGEMGAPRPWNPPLQSQPLLGGGGRTYKIVGGDAEEGDYS